MQEAEARLKQPSEGSREWQGNTVMTDLAIDNGPIIFRMQPKA